MYTDICDRKINRNIKNNTKQLWERKIRKYIRQAIQMENINGLELTRNIEWNDYITRIIKDQLDKVCKAKSPWGR